MEAPSLCLRGLLCDVGDSKPPVDLITTRPLATLAGPSPATPGVMSGGRGAEAEPRRLSLSPLVPQAPPDHQPGGCVSAGGGLSTEPPGMCSSSPSHPLASALSPTSSGWRKAPAGLGQGRRGTHGTAGPAHRAGPWALGDPQEEGSGPSAGSDGQVSTTPGEPGGGGGLMTLTCAAKPRAPPRAGLPRGQDRAGAVFFTSPGSGPLSPTPRECQVKGETQEDQHSCPTAAGHWSLGWVTRFICSPVPTGPARKYGQRSWPPFLRPPGDRWCKYRPHAVPKSPQKPHGLQPVPRGGPLEDRTVPHLRPLSPRSSSRPKAKSGLSRAQRSECPRQPLAPSPAVPPLGLP